MADIVFTPTDVKSTTPSLTGIVGPAAITAGQVIKQDSGSLEIILATATIGEVLGIATASASPGQVITYISSGSIDFGGGLTQGEIYVVSGTLGGIAPSTDLVGSDYVMILGVAQDAQVLLINQFNSGVQK